MSLLSPGWREVFYCLESCNFTLANIDFAIISFAFFPPLTLLESFLDLDKIHILKQFEDMKTNLWENVL